MEYNKVLTNKGYAIRKSFLNEKQIEQIQKQCIVEPRVDERFAKKEETEKSAQQSLNQ